MANIDIKKLFVKVAVSNETTKLAWDNAVSGGSLDAAKIYFLDNGTLYVPFVNKYYGVSDSAWEKINKDITDEITRAKAAEEALSGRLDTVQGDGEGSIKKAVKDAVDKIMGGEGIDETLDTIKEISEWIKDPNNEDGLQGFLKHVSEFNTHVEEANTRMDNIEASIAANKNAADEKLSKFINGGEKDSEGNFVTTFPADITVHNTPVTNFKAYVAEQTKYDNAQDGWMQANSDAINAEIERAKAAEKVLTDDLATEVTRAKAAEAAEATTRAESDVNITTKLFTGDNNLKSGSEADHYNLKQLIGQPAQNADGTSPVMAKQQAITWSSASADNALNVVIGDPEATTIETSWSAINGIKADLSSKNEEITNKIDTIEASVGLSEDGAHVATTGNYTSSATTVVGEIAALDAQVKVNTDAIGVLNGVDTVPGSVANSIKTTVESLDAEVDAKDVKEYVATSVTEANGVLTGTTVAVTYGDYDTPTNGIATVEATKKYVDDNLASLEVTAEGDSYVDAKVEAATDNKHVIVTTNVVDLVASAGAPAEYDAEGVQTVVATPAELTGTASSLADAADIATKVKTYVDGKIAIEAARADANTLHSIKVLDSTVTDKDDKEFVTTTTVQEDGKLTSTTVEVVYAEHTPGTISDGIVNAATLNAVIGDLWETFQAS